MMILDSDEQREIILQLIKAANIPGSALDALHKFKQAVEGAQVADEKQKKREV